VFAIMLAERSPAQLSVLQRRHSPEQMDLGTVRHDDTATDLTYAADQIACFYFLSMNRPGSRPIGSARVSILGLGP